MGRGVGECLKALCGDAAGGFLFCVASRLNFECGGRPARRSLSFAPPKESNQSAAPAHPCARGISTSLYVKGGPSVSPLTRFPALRRGTSMYLYPPGDLWSCQSAVLPIGLVCAGFVRRQVPVQTDESAPSLARSLRAISGQNCDARRVTGDRGVTFILSFISPSPLAGEGRGELGAEGELGLAGFLDAFDFFGRLA